MWRVGVMQIRDAGSRPLFLLGFEAAAAARLAELLDGEAGISVVAGEEDALERVTEAGSGLLCIGPRLSGNDAAGFLGRLAGRAPGIRCVVLAAGPEAERFQEHVNDDRIFFLSRRPPPLDEVAVLLRSALMHDERVARLAGSIDSGNATLAVAKVVSHLVARIAAETDIERISGLVAEAVSGLLDATDGRFAIYDPVQETLWSRKLDAGEATRNSAASGLIGFVARTGDAIAAERVGDDPRYDSEADNSGRSPAEHFLGVPVLTPGSTVPGDVLAVLVATRGAAAASFADADRRHLEYLAVQVAPLVLHRIFETQLEEALTAASRPIGADGEPLYRPEAFQGLENGAEPGRVLELSRRTPPRERSGRAEGRVRLPFWQRLGFRARLRPMPVFQQTTNADCGATCLAIVLAYHGKEVPLREVQEVIGAGRDGADANQLLTGADAYGLRARAVKIAEIENLDCLPRGSILHWELRHFVVLDRTIDEGIWVVDPAAGRRLVRWQELRTAFTGIAVILEPAAGFTPQDRRASGTARYVRQLLRESPALARIVAISVVLQLLALALPFLTGMIVDRVVPHGDVSLLGMLAIGLAAVVGFHFLATFLRARLLLGLRIQLDSRMTLDFLDHLVDLPYSFFQQRSTGDLMIRLNSNTAVREILTSGALSAALDGMLVSLYLIILMVVHPVLGLVALTLGALRVVLFLTLRRRHQELMSRALQTEATSRSYQVEMLAGIETLKSLGAERKAVEHWSNLFVDELNVALERGRLSALFDSLLAALTTASPFLILGYGAFEVIRGHLTLGTMLAVSALAAGFFAPLSTLVSTALQMQLLGSYFERIDDVLDTPPEQERAAPLARPKLHGRITVDEVSFRYGPIAPMVVDDVSLEIPAGSFVALVGPSGAGKTTLAHLMVGLYLPTSGRILYDGVDLGTLDLRAVRNQLGIVNQQPYLFGGSIASNLALADPTLPRARLIEAARLAHIHEDIAAMPLGYETLLAEAALSLSGGQRQRLALARALVHRPAVLLLDEATSSLDTETELLIQQELAALRCTRIVIAHRLSTVRDADLILVMDQGRVVERGRHDELMERGGRYGELVAAQMRA
ncbi:MAG TPA: ABC transporter transmembrane domain-containing protein [Thermoanaerobaculia bacterium]|nr:ABC transporter transmembrane domain-containing protein [Thermoanaerobaculia bacterium]